MTPERKDRGWLQRKLVALLEDASAQGKPDHTACAKYAEILFKMLPSVDGSKDPSWLDEEREKLKATRES